MALFYNLGDYMEQLIKFFEEMADKCNIDWPMPIEAQLNILSKRNKAKMETITVKQFDPEQDKEVEVFKEMPIFCFKSVICKYRPHLYLGDIWIAIIPIMKGKYDFQCKYYEEMEDGTFQLTQAEHPHISNGKPCLGNFAPEIIGSLQSGNLIRFFSQFKLYLASYNGRSTFTRGNVYKKAKRYYKMFSQQYAEQEYPDTTSTDLYEVMKDPMRWTLPEGLACLGTFIHEGQDRARLTHWIRGNRRVEDKKPYYFHEAIGYSDSYDHTSGLQKINGYIMLLHTVCNVSIIRSYKLMSSFLEVLGDQRSGITDQDKVKRLKEINHKYAASRYSDYQVTPRYTVSIGRQERVNIDKDRKTIDKVVGKGTEISLVEMIKYPGDVFSKFLAMFKSGNLHKATLKQFSKPEAYRAFKEGRDDSTVDGIIRRFEDMQTEKIKAALTTLEKDKRRMLNELNKSKAIYRQNDGGQSSLFSDEI